MIFGGLEMKKRIVSFLLGSMMLLSSVVGVYASSTGSVEVPIEESKQFEEMKEDNQEESIKEEMDLIKNENVESEESKESGITEEYNSSELAEQVEILNSIRSSILSANLDLTISGSSDEENEECELAFEDYGKNGEIELYNDTEYNSLPSIGSKHEVGSLTTDYGVDLWQRTAIDVVDYWNGYSTGWDIVDEWDRGVIGATFPNSPSGGTPMWCLQPGKNFVRTNRLIGNALDFLSQDEITCLGLIDQYCDKYINDIPIKDGGYPNYEDGRWSSVYGMKQLCFWTFLETTRPSFPNGSFINHNGVNKTVHNAPVMFEANAQFEGGGYGFIGSAVQYALDNRHLYKGYGKVAYNTKIENQLVGVFTVEEKEVKTKLEIKKVSADGSLTNGNPNYSLAGAVYGVYRDSACTNKVGEITTDVNGKGTLSNLSSGRYYIKEISPSNGYNLDTNVYPVDCTI